MSTLECVLADLISANHILHYHHVFQAEGSISVRNPENPNTLFTSCLPPILVTSREHLVEFNIHTGELAKQPEGEVALWELNAPAPEVYVHSCIYNRYPAVQSVVHAQTMNGIVYGLCDAGGSMVMPVYNKAGFIGNYSPIFNPAKYYDRLPLSHPHDLCVSHKLLGDEMAHLLHQGTPGDLPDCSCVLLRGNGVALWNQSIQGAVHRAIHFDRSTMIQTAAMLQRSHSDLDVTYLNDREATDSHGTASKYLRFMWAAWVAEIQGQSQYRNEISLERKSLE